MIDLSLYRRAFIDEERASVSHARLAISALRGTPGEQRLQFEIMRRFHSVSSACELMGMVEVGAECRRVEHAFKEFIDSNAPATSQALDAATLAAEHVEQGLVEMEKKIK